MSFLISSLVTRPLQPLTHESASINFNFYLLFAVLCHAHVFCHSDVGGVSAPFVIYRALSFRRNLAPLLSFAVFCHCFACSSIALESAGISSSFVTLTQEESPHPFCHSPYFVMASPVRAKLLSPQEYRRPLSL